MLIPLVRKESADEYLCAPHLCLVAFPVVEWLGIDMIQI